MTIGATILAFNNGTIDYVALAAWSARRIKHWLKIPVCIITDAATVDPIFDHVVQTLALGERSRYFEDLAALVPWHNANRADAYDLTPWDRTLLLDADYVVNSDVLSAVIDTCQEFTCHRYAWDLATGQMMDDLNWLGRYRFPQWWATVMVFDRSPHARHIFDTMRMVRKNWEHYRLLYSITNPTFRNDHALSIALGVCSGHTLVTRDIAWPMMSIMPHTALTQIDEWSFGLEYKRDHKPLCCRIAHTDFHAMGKGYLGAIVASH
jgi:hypothetical protein